MCVPEFLFFYTKEYIMKSLQYYKKQIFIIGCLGVFPLLTFAQETLSSDGGLYWDYSGSRVERRQCRKHKPFLINPFYLVFGHFRRARQNQIETSVNDPGHLGIP